MAVKDKLVTLEDLKTAYDKLKEMLDMYEDITSSLTWNNATFYLSSFGLKRPSDSGYNADGVANVKAAKIPVSTGEKYRIHLWVSSTGSYSNGTANGRCIPGFLTNANDDVIAMQPVTDPVSSNQATPAGTFYTEAVITIPASAKYLYIYDYAGHSTIGRTTGETIVEKSI